MEAGASWLKLGTAGSAVPVFEDSRARWSAAEQVRDHALCLARLATAYAATGEPGQACAVAGELDRHRQRAGLSPGRQARSRICEIALPVA